MKYKILKGTECWFSSTKSSTWLVRKTKSELILESKDYVEWKWAEEAGIKDLIFMKPVKGIVWTIKVDQRKVVISES